MTDLTAIQIVVLLYDRRLRGWPEFQELLGEILYDCLNGKRQVDEVINLLEKNIFIV